MIRRQLHNRLRSILNSKNFQADDFSIFETVGTVTITYDYEKTYFFEFQMVTSVKASSNGLTSIIGSMNNPNDGYTYQIKSIPGRLLREEKLKVEGTQTLYSSIEEWVRYLWQELVAAPIDREFERQQEQIEEIKGRIDRIEDIEFDNYFSKEEGEKLKTRLDELEKLWSEKINSDSKNEVEAKASIDSIHRQIENLKDLAPVLNKRNWFKLYGVRILGWMSKEENRKFLKDASDFVTPLLPEEIKGMLPPGQ